MQAAMDQAYRFLAQRFLSSYELTQKMRRNKSRTLSLRGSSNTLGTMIISMMSAYLNKY